MTGNTSSILVLADVHLGLPEAPGVAWAKRALQTGKDAGAKYFIFAGDLIDRDHINDHSLAEARELFESAAELFEEVHFVSGNHDVHAELLLPGCRVHESAPHAFHCGRTIVHTAAVMADPDGREVLGEFELAQGENGEPHLGVLHTSLTGKWSAKPCLPAQIEEMQALNYRAWILGHVHTPREVSADPFIGWVGMGRALLFDPSAESPVTSLVVEAKI